MAGQSRPAAGTGHACIFALRLAHKRKHVLSQRKEVVHCTGSREDVHERADPRSSSPSSRPLQVS